MRTGVLDADWSWSRQIFESVANGITIADATAPDMPLIYVNPAFEQLTGYSQTEILGLNCRFLQAGDTEQPGLAVLRQALAQEREVRTVLKNYRKDGTMFWNELYLSPIRDREGKLMQYVGIQNDVTGRVELEARLDYMAHHDMLTGLVNRALLLDRMERALLAARRNGNSVAVLVFDLDNFKVVNDMFGHDTGDTLLTVVAARLRSGARGGDTVARLGGDEFVVLVPDVEDEAEARSIMQRIADEIHRPMLVEDEEFKPSASVGIAMFPRDGHTAQELVRAADLAMYRAKHSRKSEEADRANADSEEGSLERV